MTRWDAIVIGAGPAGSTAARILADQGRAVLVLERAAFPRFHVGESLMPYDAALLERLGCAEAVQAAGTVKRGAEFTSADGSARRVEFTAQGDDRTAAAFNVERAEFDDILLRRARSAGAHVHVGARVAGPLTAPDGRITGVRYVHEGVTREEAAPVVLDASGRAGVLTHQHLRTRVASDRLRMVAVWRHFHGVDEAAFPGHTGDIQVGDHADGWVWAIPVRADKLSVGTVTTPELVRRLGPDRVFDTHVARIPRILQRLSGARPGTRLLTERDFSYHTETVCGPGFFALGDAACFVDPIFSGGVFLAMITGLRAAELTAALLRGEIAEAAALEAYARFYKTGYDCYFRLTYAFYDHGFKLGRYLKSTGSRVEPKWMARLLSGDFWSRENALAEVLRAEPGYGTFAPFERLYGCPVYEPAPVPVSPP